MTGNSSLLLSNRYKLSGHVMPGLKDFMTEAIGISLEHKTPAQPELTAADIPSPILNERFMADLKRSGVNFSDDPQDRLFRAHGKAVNSVNYLLDFPISFQASLVQNLRFNLGNPSPKSLLMQYVDTSGSSGFLQTIFCYLQVTHYMMSLFYEKADLKGFQMSLCGQVSGEIYDRHGTVRPLALVL